jgi:hypothetical protein
MSRKSFFLILSFILGCGKFPPTFCSPYAEHFLSSILNILSPFAEHFLSITLTIKQQKGYMSPYMAPDETFYKTACP